MSGDRVAGWLSDPEGNGCCPGSDQDKGVVRLGTGMEKVLREKTEKEKWFNYA